MADILTVSHGAIDRLGATRQANRSGVESANQMPLGDSTGRRRSVACRLGKTSSGPIGREQFRYQKDSLTVKFQSMFAYSYGVALAVVNYSRLVERDLWEVHIQFKIIVQVSPFTEGLLFLVRSIY